jgi:hypothetical protein
MLMKIGILGSGGVGQTLGTALVAQGHEVKIGTRDTGKLAEWVAKNGTNASAGSFAEAATFGEMILLATHWGGTENALQLAQPSNLAGKIVIDITNPLLFSEQGVELAVGFSDSAGEMVQRWLPQAKVVKALNSITAAIMVDADLLGETATMFIAGDDAEAKAAVTKFLQAFDWDVVDLGGIKEARLLEPLAMIWIRYFGITKNWQHAIKLIRK